MSDPVANREVQEETFPATVVSVLNNYYIVINRGTADGVEDGQTFLLYELGGEIHDPNTGESLGLLEIPKGTGEVVHAQERMATIQSDRFKEPTKRIIKRGPLGWPGDEEQITPSDKRVTFNNPEVGNYVKPV